MTPVTLDSVGTTAQQAATGPDSLNSYQIKNGNGYTIYVKLYDAEADDVDPASSVPDEVITVAANSTATSDNFSFDYATALSVRCTKEVANNDTTAVSVSPLIEFQFTPFIIRKASVTINNAQIKALPTTAIEIAPAPGEGKFIVFVTGRVVLDNTAGEYDNVDGAVAFAFRVVGQAGANDVSGVVDLGWLLEDGSAVGVAEAPPFAVSQIDPPKNVKGNSSYITDYENLALKFVCTNGSAGNFTAGHADNTLTLNAYYAIIDI